MKRIIHWVLVLLILHGSAAFADDTPLMKTRDGKTMSVADLERILNYYDEQKKKVLEQNPQYKAVILQRIAQGIAISNIAKEQHFDKRADIREQLELLENDFIASEYLKQEVVGKIQVTEEDMKLYYKAHESDFRIPEMVRIRHIFFKAPESASEEERKQKRAEAVEILERLKAGSNFTELATEVSDDERSKAKGGDIGFVQRGKMPPEYDAIAFAMKPGDVSGVVETRSGFYIIKLEERREPSVEPFEKVKDKIREKVFAEFKKAKVEEFVEKAMREAGIEVNIEPLLAK